MSFTHTIDQNWKTTGRSINAASQSTGEAQISLDESAVANATTNVAAGCDPDDVKMWYMLATSDDPAAQLTVQPRDATPGDLTGNVVLNMGEPYVKTELDTLFFSGGVMASMDLDNSSTTDPVRFQCEILYDPTPTP